MFVTARQNFCVETFLGGKFLWAGVKMWWNLPGQRLHVMTHSNTAEKNWKFNLQREVLVCFSYYSFQFGTYLRSLRIYICGKTPLKKILRSEFEWTSYVAVSWYRHGLKSISGDHFILNAYWLSMNSLSVGIVLIENKIQIDLYLESLKSIWCQSFVPDLKLECAPFPLILNSTVDFNQKLKLHTDISQWKNATIIFSGRKIGFLGFSWIFIRKFS